MVIINQQDYNILTKRMDREKYIFTPIFRDLYYHRIENSILCANIMFLNGDSYTISISHKDAPQFPLYITEHCISNNSKLFDINTIDIFTILYINNQPLPVLEMNSCITEYHIRMESMVDVNKVVPLMMWNKTLVEYNKKLLNLYIKYESSVNSLPYSIIQDIIYTLRDIENSGVACNKDRLVERFGEKTARYFKGDLLYSEYNPYTLTNRPSNRFGGINFSALNKRDGSREAFISRYTDGMLVQFDFEAYHLRLVADEHGITLPTGSLHMELAKKYFNTEEITDDLYAASKQKTFEIMYGMTNETYGVELFESIVHIRRFYKDVTGPFVLPSGVTVNFTEPNISKMFNYHVQSLEIVKTLPKLQKVLELLKNTNNHLVLYTYDSILLDMQTFDANLVQEITEVLEENKKFPVRIHAGKTYDVIKEIRL